MCIREGISSQAFAHAPEYKANNRTSASQGIKHIIFFQDTNGFAIWYRGLWGNRRIFLSALTCWCIPRTGTQTIFLSPR